LKMCLLGLCQEKGLDRISWLSMLTCLD
jgi:hypothetical protein